MVQTIVELIYWLNVLYYYYLNISDHDDKGLKGEKETTWLWQVQIQSVWWYW